MTGVFRFDTGESVLFVSQGGTHEQDERLLAALNRTWSLVPPEQREVIHEYYSKRFNGLPRVFLAPLGGAGTAGMPKDPFMLWFGLPIIFELPRGEQDIALAIAEELAHAFMIAIGHESHKEPPTNDKTSPEYLAFDNAREEAMKGVLYSRPFVDRAEHEKLIATVQEKARSMRGQGK
jgi:hypothetical protein